MTDSQAVPRTAAGKRLADGPSSVYGVQAERRKAVLDIEAEAASLVPAPLDLAALREALDDAMADAGEEARRFAPPFEGGFREGARWALNRIHALPSLRAAPATPDALSGRICPKGHWRANGDEPCATCAATPDARQEPTDDR